MKTLTIKTPDDMHLHLRDADMLEVVCPHTAREFARAIVMPNLFPPVTTVGQALDYRQRIKGAAGKLDFRPLMTLYLTDQTTPEEIRKAAAHPEVLGVKLYPAGATTNSSLGVTRLSKVMPALEEMARTGLVLQVHGEVTDPHVDIFDREAEFIEQALQPLVRELPELKVVLEHITTADGAQFVEEGSDQLAATITAHHLWFSRNDLFKGGIRPHYYCLPILKREQHRHALINAATSGKDCFFLGTDSAPHNQARKESACGCAGIYTAHAALPMYVSLFEQFDALDKLEHFASLAGAKFYGLLPNQGEITLEKKSWVVPKDYPVPGGDALIPLFAGQRIDWRVKA